MRAETAEVRQLVILECSTCGATGQGTCGCGTAYMPARQRAAQAIAEHPEKSNVMLAEELGVSEATVRRARPTSSDDEVDERIGLDGKTRRMPHRKEFEEDPENYVTAFLLRADQAREFATYTGPPTKEIAAAARQAATAWLSLANEMEKSL